jgi:hypothetical protein
MWTGPLLLLDRYASVLREGSNQDLSAQTASPQMVQLLRELRQKAVIGFIGGSDLAKISEQLSVVGGNGQAFRWPSAAILTPRTSRRCV